MTPSLTLRRLRLLLAPLGAALLVIFGATASYADGGEGTLAPIRDANTLAFVHHAGSTLNRDEDGISFRLHTTLAAGALPAGDFVRVEYRVFNDPSQCHTGAPIALCGGGDRNPTTGYSRILGPTGLPEEHGGLRLRGSLAAGDLSHVVSGRGLTAPQKAEVQLFIRACPPSNPIAGCSTLQFSVQDPQTSSSETNSSD